jgi:carboxylesterase type B
MVVKVQYRLGLWGFLKLEGGHANNGIWDQVKAIEQTHGVAGKKEGSKG